MNKADDLAGAAKAVGKADDVGDAAKARANTDDLAGGGKAWKVGDSIDAPTKAGNSPSWTTVRQRFWKNEAIKNSDSWSPANLQPMRNGLAPVDNIGRPYELHHLVWRSQGGSSALPNLEILTHDQHLHRHVRVYA